MSELLYKAIWHNDVEQLKKLVNEGHDVTFIDNTLFKYACIKGYDEIVKYLLTIDSVDPSAGNNYCLYYAIYNSHYNIIKMLLDDYRVDPSKNNNFMFSFSLQLVDKTAMKMLLHDDRVVKKITYSEFEQYSEISECLQDILNLNEEELKQVLNFI